ncbi:MAG: hypothetical protein Q9167_000763 [Letrouitia subvulpina]
MALPEPLVLDKKLHIKYLLRCLKTYLPTAYTSNDSQRMTLAFFTLSALDLLDALESSTTLSERQAYIDWIYSCQHPHGGFRGFTGADMGEREDGSNHHWDPANIAATYFAIANLAILGDDLQGIERKKCLLWLRKLQLDNGTFGEALGQDGQIQGGKDVRFCFCATSIWWMLGGDRQKKKELTKSINVEMLLSFIKASQTYEGGFAKAPFNEAHAGWTYCAVSALSLLGDISASSTSEQTTFQGIIGPASIERLVQWLTSRQTTTLHEDDIPMAKDDDLKASQELHRFQGGIDQSTSGTFIGAVQLNDPRLWFEEESPKHAGLNGRCSKPADTCYTFWTGGSLTVSALIQSYDTRSVR